MLPRAGEPAQAINASAGRARRDGPLLRGNAGAIEGGNAGRNSRKAV
jgi:hypothetical protein